MSRARILVVDDEAGMLRSMERILAPQHEVTALRVPEEALPAAREQPFDVAVLDVRMPGMDGFELMAALKEIQPDLDVILMTGSAHEADARLIRAIRERAFFFLTKPFDRDVLLTLVSRCLERRRATVDRRIYLQRLEHELRAAQRFQTSLLPVSPLRVGRFEVRSRYLPWSQLGGDFYDVAPARAGGALLMIADVSGHGASAAMLTGVLKLAFREGVAAGEGPAGIMGRLAVCTRLFPDEGHLTAICVRMDGAGRRLVIVNAGHPPGYLVGGGGRLVQLESTAPIVHPALGEGPYEEARVAVEPGDRLFLYTDGVIESRRAYDDGGEGLDGGEQFGLARLEDALRASPRDLIDGVTERLAAFRAGRPLEDDVALLSAEMAHE